MFSIKDIMVITNLSERTIRRHLESGKIKGSKVGGVWRFTEEQLNGFYDYNDAIKKIRSEATQIVFDFINMPNPEKLRSNACIMIDLRIDEKEIEEVKSIVMDECNLAQCTMKMKFLKEQDNYRFILSGTLDFIQQVTTKIHRFTH